MKKALNTKRVVLIDTLAVITAVFLAIAIKSLLPADVNVEDFDSRLVNLIGFPAVAILYFIIIYVHCIMVMQYFGKKSNLSKQQIGVRFGSVFAAMYLFGMQEVVVEASPFNEWGLLFMRYQFIIGITDAIPVLLLCLATSYLILNKNNSPEIIDHLKLGDKIKTVSLITVTFFIQRAIGYETGLVNSNAASFPIPTYLWTALFGLVLGLSYVVLYPVFSKTNFSLLQPFQIAVLTIGINWILFNSFIGLIFQDVMGQMLFRTGIDIAVLYATSLCAQLFFYSTDKTNDNRR
ncbi:hypothetical protein [Alkalibacterium sp.]|nr:MAG: hypothetical protein EA249_03785 [Alkalibacterium sp.]